MIAVPPLLAGAVQLKVASVIGVSLSDTTDKDTVAGAPGLVAIKVAVEVMVVVPVPMLLVALTLT